MSPNPIALTDDQLDIVRRAGSDATVIHTSAIMWLGQIDLDQCVVSKQDHVN